MQPCRTWRAIAVASLTSVAACTTNVDPTPVAVVTVFPAADSSRVGETRQVEAQVFDANNNRLQGRRVAWRSNEPAIATVDSQGVVRGVSPGFTLIVATVDGKSGQASWRVIAAVDRVAVAPLTAEVPLGSSRQLAANVLDQQGNAIPGRPITWSSSNSTVATVSVAGLVSAVALGRATITATVEGKSGQSIIDVVDPAASVRITPAGPQILRIGGKVQLTATALNAAGQPLPGRAATWISSNPNVASVNAAGEVTAVAVGQASISAEIEGRSAQTPVTVTLIPVSNVTLTPNTLTLFKAEQRQLTLTSTDSTGAAITNYQGRAVNYQSSNLPVANVTQQGVVVAVDTGTATVSATVDGVFSNNVQVTVRLVPVNNITVNPNPASIQVNNTLQFTATLRDANGNILVGRPVVWATSDANKATITAAGVLTGLTPGTLTVTATSEGVVGTANVTVFP